MATLSVQDVTPSGLTPAAKVAANAGGDRFLNDGKTYVEITTGSSGATTVTIGSQTACDQGSTHNTNIAINANVAQTLIGPFPTSRYNDSNGYVQLAYSAVTNVTVGVFQL